MDQASKVTPLSALGETDRGLGSVLVPKPQQAETLALLYDVSHELTSILDREELLRRIAERVKKLVNYHAFTVMLWSEEAQDLESVFSMRYEDKVPARGRIPFNQGIDDRKVLVKCGPLGHAPEALRRTIEIP